MSKLRVTWMLVMGYICKCLKCFQKYWLANIASGIRALDPKTFSQIAIYKSYPKSIQTSQGTNFLQNDSGKQLQASYKKSRCNQATYLSSHHNLPTKCLVGY